MNVSWGDYPLISRKAFAYTAERCSLVSKNENQTREPGPGMPQPAVL